MVATVRKKTVRRAKLTHRRSTRQARVVYEDDDLIVVDKPAGLLTVGTDRERHRTLHRQLFRRERLRRPGGQVFVVHRLDRDASGLLVFAKSEEVKHALQDQFHDRSASRTYLAIVAGSFPREEHVFRSHLAENRALRVYVTQDTRRGKPAATRVRVLRRTAAATLLRVELETGRKHQIRVHLATEGFPILGDRRYGEDRAGPIGRLALHAASLEFRHPTEGDRRRFESPPPREFSRAGL